MLTARERIKIVRNLLDSQDYALISEKELEKLGSYILNGDPYFKSMQTHRVIEITANDGTSIVRKPDRFPIRRTQYYKDETIAVYGHDWDEDGRPITQLRGLWKEIDKLATLIKMYYCKIPPDEYVLLHPITGRQLYDMGRQLVQLRKSQFDLLPRWAKSVYHTKSFAMHDNGGYPINLSEDTGYWVGAQELCKTTTQQLTYSGYDWATDRYFKVVSRNLVDFHNPVHLQLFLKNYKYLLAENYDKIGTDIWMMIQDLDAILANPNLPEWALYGACAIAHGVRATRITKEILETYGIFISPDDIISKICRTISNSIATGPDPNTWVRCPVCKRYQKLENFPKNPTTNKYLAQCNYCAESNVSIVIE